MRIAMSVCLKKVSPRLDPIVSIAKFSRGIPVSCVACSRRVFWSSLFSSMSASMMMPFCLPASLMARTVRSELGTRGWRTCSIS